MAYLMTLHPIHIGATLTEMLLLIFFFSYLKAPDRPPKIISTKLKGKFVNIAWEQVEPLNNESSIDGYRVSTIS